MKPLHTGGRFDAEAKVASAPGQIERELGFVAAIHTAGSIAAVKRPIEKLRAVLDDKVRAFRTIAQRAFSVVGRHAAGLRIPFARGARRRLRAARYLPCAKPSHQQSEG